MNAQRGSAVIAAATLIFASQGASAQTDMRDIAAAGRSDLRATASIRIPLGGPRQARDTAPRVELAMHRMRIQPGTAAALRSSEPFHNGRTTLNRTALSVTFEQSPRMLVNGRQVATFGPTLGSEEGDGDQRRGVSTLGWVAIGVGVFIGLGVAAAADLNDAIDDINNPD